MGRWLASVSSGGNQTGQDSEASEVKKPALFPEFLWTQRVNCCRTARLRSKLLNRVVFTPKHDFLSAETSMSPSRSRSRGGIFLSRPVITHTPLPYVVADPDYAHALCFGCRAFPSLGLRRVPPGRWVGSDA